MLDAIVAARVTAVVGALRKPYMQNQIVSRQRIDAVLSGFGALTFIFLAAWAGRDLFQGKFHVHPLWIRWGDGGSVIELNVVVWGGVLALVLALRAVAKWRAARPKTFGSNHGAAPNGGPVSAVGDTKVHEGPPSVS